MTEDTPTTEPTTLTVTCPLCQRSVQNVDGNIKPHRPKRGPGDTKTCKRIALRDLICNGGVIMPKPLVKP